MMHRHFKQTEPLQDRVASFAREVRVKASRLPPGKEKDNLLRRARLADMASQLDDWANSPGLQPMHTNSRGYKAGPQKEDREAVMAQRRPMAR